MGLVSFAVVATDLSCLLWLYAKRLCAPYPSSHYLTTLATLPVSIAPTISEGAIPFLLLPQPPNSPLTTLRAGFYNMGLVSFGVVATDLSCSLWLYAKRLCARAVRPIIIPPYYLGHLSCIYHRYRYTTLHV